MKNEDFYTFSGYIRKDNGLLTASMEDYVEMIYRLSINKGFTRINDLANALNVQPPSVTKAVQKLAELNLANYEKYGVIILTEEGKIIGESLLKRHNMVEEFLRIIGVSNSLLEETEKIEHSVNEETFKCISNFVNFIKNNPEIRNALETYRNLKESD
jgi:Mn-dependent DtxR family transcriptional regulator